MKPRGQNEPIEVQVTGDERRPMTLAESAEYLDISKSHLYQLTSKSIIPHYKPGGKKIYFEKKDLDRYLQRHRVSSIEEVRKHVE